MLALLDLKCCCCCCLFDCRVGVCQQHETNGVCFFVWKKERIEWGNGHNTAQTPATLRLIVTGGQMCMLVALEKECGADVCLMLIIVPSFVVGVCI